LKELFSLLMSTLISPLPTTMVAPTVLRKGERILMSPRGGGVNRRVLKNHHLKQIYQWTPETLDFSPEFLGSLESLEKSAESLDWHLHSGIATLPKTGATGFANPVCWRLIIVSKFVCDSQAYKSPVAVKGPFFPRVVNPRYRIRGTNVWRKSWSSKAK
jgi:hypothetical protein